MPNYEYRCLDCGKTYIVPQSVKEHEKPPLPPCPGCKSTNVRVHFGGVSVVTSKKS